MSGLGIRPIVRLTAPVIQLRKIAAGTGVGYGMTFRAPEERRIATIAVGYADGWPFHLGNKGAVYHGDVRLPIVGRVSMDCITVDATALAEGALKAGDPVELIGAHQSIDQVASDAGTIPYEILTRLGHRYARREGDLSPQREGKEPLKSRPGEGRDRHDHRLVSCKAGIK